MYVDPPAYSPKKNKRKKKQQLSISLFNWKSTNNNNKLQNPNMLQMVIEL